LVHHQQTVASAGINIHGVVTRTRCGHADQVRTLGKQRIINVPLRWHFISCCIDLINMCISKMDEAESIRVDLFADFQIDVWMRMHLLIEGFLSQKSNRTTLSFIAALLSNLHLTGHYMINAQG
jgi:hypothetical protein